MLEGLADDVTVRESREPELNDWAPGATRDTSTPRAAPLLIAIVSNRDSADAEPDDELIARTASVVAAELT